MNVSAGQDIQRWRVQSLAGGLEVTFQSKTLLCLYTSTSKCLSMCLSMRLSTSTSTCLSTCQSMSMSMSMSMPTCLSMCLCVYVSVSVSLSVSICASVGAFVPIYYRNILTLTYWRRKNGDISGGEWLGCGLSNFPLTLPSPSSRFSSSFQCSIRRFRILRQWSIMFSFHRDAETRADIEHVG